MAFYPNSHRVSDTVYPYRLSKRKPLVIGYWLLVIGYWLLGKQGKQGKQGIGHKQNSPIGDSDIRAFRDFLRSAKL
ncbi:MAG: hypothetical protein EAZ90_28330 [Oscillatoriales cyanobacterium]|nr:MAG: hypothetical protein EAZ94_03735 [Oscillatoriales cyanobacterium]TAE27451.1 MAG: hypothetical protein EAZ93_05870 [Oscillatoriales cyanobacterium]TAE36515.1 MAG: hypothetical protein EAZ90_28330 [Oscillatoriales cyanobacterium]TAE48978.1 MAG: hypothetical protein EAZ88_23250 [Oscillatoriales cyanobacterium]TAF91890.1 MAG: hypothetical protein EAZ49_03715 [Oscillatoriales cyanobacterium]